MLETSPPEAVGLSNARFDRVRSWLDDQISCERLAGVSVLVARRGKVAFFETSGKADIETGQPFAQDTVARIYSMTKPITTVAAMMLYEQGCFQLDDPIAKYLPEFSDMRVWPGGAAAIDQTEPAATPITVKQIMTHTSGLTYGFMQASPVDAQYRERGIDLPGATGDLAGRIRSLAEIPLLCQPGSAWNYSVSTDVLGRLVEVWSGQSLREFFVTNIFQPLAMPDTDFHVKPDNHARFATLYAPPGGGDLASVGRAPAGGTAADKPTGLTVMDRAAASAFLEPATLYSGGGGLVGTVPDYARFCQMLLNNGELDGVRLLGRTTVEHMRRNHLPDNRDMAAMGQPVWSETSYNGIGFGLGFAVVIDPVKAHIITSAGEYHWGGAASTFFWLDPQEQLFTILFTQLMPSSTYPIRRELRTRVYQALV